jgi:cobalt-zinc-cadmium efflux system outer membrane protein
MYPIIFISMLVGVALFCAPDTEAQPLTLGALPGNQITLADALKEALDRNRDLAVSRRDIDISRGRLQQARRYPFNPELVVDGETGSTLGREDSQRRGVGGGKIGLSQVVEIRGQRGLRVRGAEVQVGKAEWATRETEREVAADTTRAFSDLVLARERLGLAQETLTLATGLRDAARRLVDVGDAPEIDLLRTEVEVRRAVNRVRQEEAGVRAASSALGLLIGASADAVFVASGTLLLPPVPGTLEQLLADARRSRPDLRVAEANIESARAARALVEAERFVPSVTLSASYGDKLDFDGRTKVALFGVSIPLPFWNRRDGDLQAAQAEVARQEAERERVLARMDKEIVTAFRQFAATLQVVEEYVRQIIPAQEQNVQLIDQGYRAGQLRLTDALLAQRDFIEVRTAYLDAIASHNAAQIELQRVAAVQSRGAKP